MGRIAPGYANSHIFSAVFVRSFTFGLSVQFLVKCIEFIGHSVNLLICHFCRVLKGEPSHVQNPIQFRLEL